MAGGDSRGCVSVAPGGGVVYFQEGDACPIIPGIGDAANVSGSLLCSSFPGPPLDNNNCAITSTQYYPTSGGPPRHGCPWIWLYAAATARCSPAVNGGRAANLA